MLRTIWHLITLSVNCCVCWCSQFSYSHSRSRLIRLFVLIARRQLFVRPDYVFCRSLLLSDTPRKSSTMLRLFSLSLIFSHWWYCLLVLVKIGSFTIVSVQTINECKFEENNSSQYSILTSCCIISNYYFHYFYFPLLLQSSESPSKKWYCVT